VLLEDRGLSLIPDSSSLFVLSDLLLEVVAILVDEHAGLYEDDQDFFHALCHEAALLSLLRVVGGWEQEEETK